MINQNTRGSIRRFRAAFTLIELLVVISIIAILVALTIPVMGAIKRQQYIKHAQSELAYLTTAIDGYHSVFGYYPPSNAGNPTNAPLYYELMGVTNNGTSYVPLDGNTDADIKIADMQKAFGIGGFMNCGKGSGEEAMAARTFLTGLKTSQYTYTTNNGIHEYIIISALGGPNPAYHPLGGNSTANPWRYNSVNPANNPQSYDLWLDLAIGKTNRLTRISNWNKQVVTYSPP